MITKQMPKAASNGFFMITCDQLQQEEKSTRHVTTSQDFLTNSVLFIVETSLQALAEERMDLTHEVNHSYVLFMVNMHYCKLLLKLWTLFIIYLQVDSHVMNSELHRPSINTGRIYQTPKTNKTEPSLVIPSRPQLVHTMKKLNF